MQYQAPVPNWSKAPWGLSVLARVTSIFTGTSISPGALSRQRSNHYAFRAGRNLPDKEFRYLRTVIVTAAVYWGLDSKNHDTGQFDPAVGGRLAARAVHGGRAGYLYGKRRLFPGCGRSLCRVTERTELCVPPAGAVRQHQPALPPRQPVLRPQGGAARRQPVWPEIYAERRQKGSALRRGDLRPRRYAGLCGGDERRDRQARYFEKGKRIFRSTRPCARRPACRWHPCLSCWMVSRTSTADAPARSR